MKQLWRHPELGRFEYDWTGWVRTFQLPAFKLFEYRYYGKRIGTSDIPITLDVEDDDEDDPQPPSRGAIRVAQLVIKNQQVLAEKSVRALWRDLKGQGRESGVWWHGELQKPDGFSDLTSGDLVPDDLGSAITKPVDLHRFLGGVTIRVFDSVYRLDKPCATIDFEAAFEIEHGAGVLTDGRTILGTGYGGGEARPYEVLDESSGDD